MLESGGEKTQPVPQKQRKNACMAVLPLTIVIAVGGCVGEMGFDGIIGGGHMINNAYAEESVLLVTNETAKLLARDGAVDDRLGRSVSVYGNTAVIGAILDDDNGPDSGSAYVFEKNSTGHWMQKQKLLASDGEANDHLGYSVSVYNNTAVIGAVNNDDNGPDSGSAYVFEKNSTGHWMQKQKLLASDGEANDHLGYSVSVYNNTAVIGAVNNDDNGTSSGSAYVFEKNSTGHWTQKQKLLADDAAIGDWFGNSISVYNNTAVIGAVHNDTDFVGDSGSAYVFEKNSTGHWTQKQKLLLSDGVRNDRFGRSVSVYNNTAVIGASGDDGSGSAYVFEKNSGNWTQKQKLLASDGAIKDRFGQSVSVYNNTAVIGAFRDDYDDDDVNENSGSAYVFEKNSTGHWMQKQKLLASDGEANDLFGRSVSVYGNTAVIGAVRDYDNGPYSGSAYVFEKNSGNWTQKQKLLASDGAVGDQFGYSVSVYSNIAVIGAYNDDDNGPDSGSAYVFEKNSGNWTQKQKLLASDGEADEYFGYSVSVYGNTAVIGAYNDDDNGSSSGSAYVFEKNSTSGNWTQKKLLASDGEADEYFGYSVSVYGNTAVIGAYNDDDNGSSSGSAYVFEKNSTSGNWTQKKLLASDGEADEYFGYSVSVYGNTAVIGAYNDDDNGTSSGSAYVFEKNSTSGNWTQKKLLASDGEADDQFGRSVSVYGNTAVIGASGDNGSGSAYVFEKNSTSGDWTQKKLLASDGTADDRFGRSVSVYGNTAVIGAYYDDDDGTSSGSAYVFEKNSTGHWTQKQKLLASDGEAYVHLGYSVSVYSNTAVIGAYNDDDNGPYSGSAYVFTISANQTPTAHAGDDQTVNEGDDVTLDGTGSADPNGDTITYLWSQNENNAFEVTLSSSTSASPTFTAPTVTSDQTLTFSLTVNDGAVDSTPDTVDITIQNTINESPTAHAGDDQTVGEGASVTLDGTGSADPNGDTITYLWSQNENNAFEVTLFSSTSVSPTFTAPTVTSEQILTFSLTVNDGAVDSTPDTVIVTILDTDGNGVPNLTPTAHAGDDQTVGEGAKEVTLNGSATDPDTDDTITYLWSQTQGPTVTLSSSTSASPTFTAPTVTSDQTLTFSLTVNDGAVDSTPDTVDITIQNTINESPTADAGDDQTVNEGDDVTLDGTGSADPNGDTITYLWSQNENNAFEVTLSSSTSASPTFTAPTVTSDQTLTFSLTVNDGAVDSTPDTVIVTILDTDGNGVPNLTPTAHAGDDQTVNEGDDVTLDGTGSADPNGDTITYLWSQNENNAFEVTLSSSTSASPTFTAPTVTSDQTLTFSLTVNDGAVDSTPDTVIVTILDTDGNGVPNLTPTAHAGDDQTVNEGDDVTLDGTGSADPNGDTITYLWSQNENNAFEVTLSSSTSASPTFTAPTVTSDQTLTFSLTVNDGAVDSTPDTVIVTILDTDGNGVPNLTPTAHAGDDQTVNEGDDVTLDGTGSADPNGDTITYLWSQNENNAFEVTLSSSTSASPTFTAPTVTSDQTLTFSLTVNDGAVDSTPDTVIVTILDTDGNGVPNLTPTAHAGDDQTVNEGDDVTLDGTGSADPNGDTITYLWSQNENNAFEVTLSSSTSASPTFTAPTVTSDQTLTFSLTVNDGAVDSTPDTVIVTILDTDGNGVPNLTPTAHAGDDQTVNEGDDVTLDGTGSADPNGDTITYLWSQNENNAFEVTLSSSTSASPTFTAPTVTSDQTLTFSLTVNDGAVDSTPDTVIVTILDTDGNGVPNLTPTAHAGDDQTVNEGDDVTLDGTGSADPNGDTITYLWSQNENNAFEVTLSSSTSASPTFTAPTVTSDQTLTFSLTVNDGAVDSTPDTVIVTILDTDGNGVPNLTPTAHAGDDQTVNEGDDVTLDGTGSADPNGDTITYLWSQNENNAFEVTLSSSTSASPTFTAPTVTSDQTLTFSLTVNDGAVDSTPDTVIVTILDTDGNGVPNLTPTAHAGDDQTVNEGDDVTLDGTGSADPNGDTITYLWSQNENNAFEVTLSSSTSASPTFTAPTVTSDQTLTFSLTVNDGAVDSTPDTVIVTILDTDGNGVPNLTPTAHAGDDQTVNEGDDVTLDGTGSADPNGDTITYLWSQNENNAFEVTLSSSTSASPTFTAPTVTSDQTLTFSLTVNDGAVDSTPDTVDITVLDTDDVLLTSPGSPSGSSGSGSSGSSSGIGTSGRGGGSGSSSGIGISGGGGGSGSSSGIGISGGGGGSGSSSGIGISGGGGGRGSSTWVDDIYLKSVSWDCNAGTIKIIAGPDSDYISVAVHTTQLGIHQASIAGDDIPGYRAFVSPMHKTEDYINIKVVALSGRNLVTISESIDVDACVGERTYHAPDDSTTTTIKQPVPKQEDDKDRLADFVDPKKNPQYYIDRYNNEIEYREWFDENYPGITIYEAVGLPVPDPTLEPAVEQEPAMKQEPEPICDPRAELVDGFCIPVTPRPEENGGGCLIATAVYGTELAPQVQLLREIRDNTVLQTQSGSAFMDSFNSFYYSFSPSIADLERQNPVFREAVKMAVTPLISSLAILDYVDIDSESEMLGYGIGIVAMNIAMYVALPVSALYYVRRLVA